MVNLDLTVHNMIYDVSQKIVIKNLYHRKRSQINEKTLRSEWHLTELKVNSLCRHMWLLIALALKIKQQEGEIACSGRSHTWMS